MSKPRRNSALQMVRSLLQHPPTFRGLCLVVAGAGASLAFVAVVNVYVIAPSPMDEWLMGILELFGTVAAALAVLINFLKPALGAVALKTPVSAPKLPLLLLLVMHPDAAEGKLGDLEQEMHRIAGGYGARYARVWYIWWGGWIFVAAVAAKMPGKFLLDALKNRVSKD